MAWEDGFHWEPGGQYDFGRKGRYSDNEGVRTWYDTKGTFGGADYFEALKRGGAGRDQLSDTRGAIRSWMQKKRGEGVDWFEDSPVADMIQQGTRIGETTWGDWTGDLGADEGKKYTKADLYADLAQGHDYGEIARHFESDPRNLSKFAGDDTYKLLQEGARAQTREDAARGPQERAAEIAKQAETFRSERDVALDDLSVSQSELGTARHRIATGKEDLQAAQGAYKSLQTKFDTELQQLRTAQAATKTNAPMAVSGPGSATSIAFAKSPTRKSATLSGLTRPAAPSQSLKVNTLNM